MSGTLWIFTELGSIREIIPNHWEVIDWKMEISEHTVSGLVGPNEDRLETPI